MDKLNNLGLWTYLGIKALVNKGGLMACKPNPEAARIRRGDNKKPKLKK